MIKWIIYFVLLLSGGIWISFKLSGKSKEDTDPIRYVFIIGLVCWFIMKLVETFRG